VLKLPILKPGDKIEIIAPASRCSDNFLIDLKNLLTSWQLHCVVSENIFGQDLLCANSDDARFEFLKNALQNPETKAVICARGGYGNGNGLWYMVHLRQINFHWNLLPH
jgi:muramoyltetrapeptide carboxypeptidase